MSTNNQPLPKELLAETETFEGKELYRFTFAPNTPDLSEKFYDLTVFTLAKMSYDHVTISCPAGVPSWLVKYFDSLEAYGLPVEVTPLPNDPLLIASIRKARRFTRFSWPAGQAPQVVPPGQPDPIGFDYY